LFLHVLTEIVTLRSFEHQAIMEGGDTVAPLPGEHQQKHADLVCGFCAFTGLEISLKKVEAISINHGGISHNTPFLVLRDWAWRPH
jgi:hypothetical protein